MRVRCIFIFIQILCTSLAVCTSRVRNNQILISSRLYHFHRHSLCCGWSPRPESMVSDESSSGFVTCNDERSVMKTIPTFQVSASLPYLDTTLKWPTVH
ncbi:hypothetical protein B0J14DRAFT_607890 [Halenospora varia]|nr:hypothetical protein B0J14DRAFT_607890 [Halenospora varia]